MKRHGEVRNEEVPVGIRIVGSGWGEEDLVDGIGGIGGGFGKVGVGIVGCGVGIVVMVKKVVDEIGERGEVVVGGVVGAAANVTQLDEASFGVVVEWIGDALGPSENRHGSKSSKTRERGIMEF